jgi:hypothetical protein
MSAIMVIVPCLIRELSAFVVIQSAELQIQLLVLGGVVITMLYQTLTIGVAAVAMATTVGMLNQAKM